MRACTISRAQTIPPDQAWFWSQRWQLLEREAQADLDAGRVTDFERIAEALAALEQVKADYDAED